MKANSKQFDRPPNAMMDNGNSRMQPAPYNMEMPNSNIDGGIHEGSSARMSTRHKGVRDKDYAAMLKNPTKRMRIGEHGK